MFLLLFLSFFLFFIFCYGNTIVSAPFGKETIWYFLHWFALQTDKDQLALLVWSYFWVFYLTPLIYVSIRLTVWLCIYIIGLEVSTPVFFFFFSVTLVSLSFPKNIGIILSIFIKKSYSNFDRNCDNPVYELENQHLYHIESSTSSTLIQNKIPSIYIFLMIFIRIL